MVHANPRSIPASDSRLRFVEGRHHPLVKDLRRAFDRGELTDDGCCAAEGIKIVEEAIRSSLKIRAVFFSEKAQGAVERLLPQLGAQVETLLLQAKLFSDVVPSETPQGVAALIKVKDFSAEGILARPHTGPLLALAGIQDPGNLGTILRSAEAFGSAGVLLGEKTVSAYNPKVIRASAGSVFRIPVAKADLLTSLPPIRQAGLRLLATSSHKGTPLQQANLSQPVALFIGSEGAGLPRELIQQMDETLVIPQEQVESLNAGVAASILLYEAARQRRQKR